jgi:outer membrane protein W
MRLLYVLSLAALLLFALALPAHATALVGIDGATATVMQEHQSSFSGLAMRLRFHPETLIRNVEIMPTIEYWRNSSDLSAFNIKSSRKDATLGVDARYVFFRDGWQPYVGVGFGLHFFSSSVDAPGLGLNNVTDSFVKGGVAGLAGITVPLTDRVHNFFELKYHHVTENRQLKLNWGISYNL